MSKQKLKTCTFPDNSKSVSLILTTLILLNTSITDASQTQTTAFKKIQVYDIYEINVDLPKSMIKNLVVTDVIPRGLIYIGDSLKISGAAKSAIVGVKTSSDGTKIEWSFKKVDNTQDLDITIQFDLVVANVPDNKDGVTLAQSKINMSFEDEDDINFGSGESAQLEIVEPCLKAVKRATLGTCSSGGLAVVHTISLYHPHSSHSDAFDVEITDSVPAGMTYIPDSIEILSGPPGTIELTSPSTIRWNFDEIKLSSDENNKVLLRYLATVDKDPASIKENSLDGDEYLYPGLKSSRLLEWTSAPGENPYKRTYSVNYGDSTSELSVSIEADPKQPKIGDVITYTYFVSNVGSNTVTNLTLTDDRLGPLNLDRTSLLPGESAVAKADYIVEEQDFRVPLENCALALGEDPFHNPVIGICRISIDVSVFIVTKAVDRKTVKPGETLNYTISLWNGRSAPVENVTVRDVFNGKVDILYVDPVPDPDGIWRFSRIGSGFKNITLTVKVPETQDFKFEMGQVVSGGGFVNVANDYKTDRPANDLINHVYVTFSLDGVTKEISDSKTVTISGMTGTQLSTRKHGSGTYDDNELIELQTEKKSISIFEDVSTTYGPTNLSLYRNRSVTYSSRWTMSSEAKNKVTGASMSESYRYASSIDRESQMELDEKGSVIEIDSNFDGVGHFGFLKLSAHTTPKSIPITESREDYTGSFRVQEKVEEYGSGLTSEKSTNGSGFVAVDKRIGIGQRSYESGTGSYESEEIVETNTNYIAKDISLVYAPVNFSLAGEVPLYQSMKWKEGIWSKTPGTSFIAEDYSGASRLDKETVARGLNEMETEANFSGKARYRAILEDMVDSDEEFEGEYSIHRKTSFQGVAKYNRPYLNVIKEGSFHEETITEGHEEKTITVANYTITLQNDGNKTLGPIYVTDFFPPGAKFINASARPSELANTRAEWVLTHLAIGDRSTITLNLDVTEYRGDELVNRVEACGVYDDERICGSNFTALEIEWLKCCPDDTVSVSKTARLDETRPNVVWYRIEIENPADISRVAKVTDSLPSDMVLLDSEMPFSSYEGDVVTWNIIDLGPMENKTINYIAEALHSGRFENQVRVDPRSVDGAATSQAYATVVINIDEFDDEMPSPGWQPPDWDFSQAENSTYFEMCEEVFS